MISRPFGGPCEEPTAVAMLRTRRYGTVLPLALDPTQQVERIALLVNQIVGVPSVRAMPGALGPAHCCRRRRCEWVRGMHRRHQRQREDRKRDAYKVSHAIAPWLAAVELFCNRSKGRFDSPCSPTISGILSESSPDRLRTVIGGIGCPKHSL